LQLRFTTQAAETLANCTGSFVQQQKTKAAGVQPYALGLKDQQPRLSLTGKDLVLMILAEYRTSCGMLSALAANVDGAASALTPELFNC